MKIKKYLKKMAIYLNVDKQKYSKRKDCLEHVLKKLKKRKHELKNELKGETNDKRCKLLQEELNVVQSQRKKGLKALKELNRENA
ncbi:hypothetical protein ACFL2V_07360 [Pseudomonadota bacterium]